MVLGIQTPRSSSKIRCKMGQDPSSSHVLPVLYRWYCHDDDRHVLRCSFRARSMHSQGYERLALT